MTWAGDRTEKLKLLKCQLEIFRWSVCLLPPRSPPQWAAPAAEASLPESHTSGQQHPCSQTEPSPNRETWHGESRAGGKIPASEMEVARSPSAGMKARGLWGCQRCRCRPGALPGSGQLWLQEQKCASLRVLAEPGSSSCASPGQHCSPEAEGIWIVQPEKRPETSPQGRWREAFCKDRGGMASN